MLIVEDWCVVRHHKEPYTAPETPKAQLHGKVYDYDNPHADDGKYCTLPYMVGKKNGMIVTFSKHEYALGKVRPEYEKEFENAEYRLAKALNEIVDPEEKK